MKKSVKIIVPFILLLFFVGKTYAQESAQVMKKGEQTIKIQTNLHCESCKTTIENDLAFLKGVKEVVADVTSKIVTVTYSAKKTNPESIVARIKALGYEANVIPNGCGNKQGSGCGGSGSGSGCGGQH